MILHTINKSPFNSNCFAECLDFCAKDSSVLLIEDGVYAAQKGSDYADTISAYKGVHFYALAADLAARGMTDRLCDNITVVDDNGFVELVTSHHSVQSWY